MAGTYGSYLGNECPPPSDGKLHEPDPTHQTAGLLGGSVPTERAIGFSKLGYLALPGHPGTKAPHVASLGVLASQLRPEMTDWVLPQRNKLA
jgi:hypothetical protein